ncbi:phosphotransferase family protein [Streptacidiphilus sp. EB129]|uniref:phosphotransferase family protein n=1 Tax=Streptacidiphilus sp. EB129 TaxID=3156262 RepID=UPI00351223A6
MATPSTPRPRTTTRDPAVLEQRLAAWVDAGEPGARIGGLSVPPSNGMSSDTVLFDLLPPGGGPARPCVLRLAPDPDAYAVFPVYDMERQYRTIRLVAERTKVPVPRLLRLETDPGPLGAPGFLMERVEGRVPPDVMPYTYGGNWLFEAGAADRASLEQATVEVLAELHTVAADEATSFLTPGRSSTSSVTGGGTDGGTGGDANGGTPAVGYVAGDALRRHVEEQHAYYTFVVAGRPRSPLIERAFARLEELWPEDSGPTVLSWGDARIGNILYQGFTPAAVLDWEMASLGPRELDLAWLIFLHRFFQDLTEGSGQPGMPDFLDRGRTCARYAEATGHPPRDMDFHLLYAALRHAVVMLRIGYRQLHYGETAAPADPDQLILHRATLEAMVEDRYWQGM